MNTDLKRGRQESKQLAERRLVQQILVRVFSFGWFLTGLLQRNISHYSSHLSPCLLTVCCSETVTSLLLGDEVLPSSACILWPAYIRSDQHWHNNQLNALTFSAQSKHTLPLQMHSFQWWKGINLTWMWIHIKPLSLSCKSPMSAALSRYLIYSSPAHSLSLSGQTAQPYCLSFWGCSIQVVMILLAPLWLTDTGFLINCVC